MAKKKDIERLLVSDLTSKIRFGESRHEAKLQAENRFNADLKYIYSIQTYETYKKTAVLFANYCKNELHITKAKSVSELKEHMISYLDKCKEKNCSNYTLKMRRSAFNKMLGTDNKLDYFVDKRTLDKITRSRKDNTFFDKHYSRTGKYKDIYMIAENTGTRREDLSKLRKSDFRFVDGQLVVDIKNSKGGRDRTSVVLNQRDVLKFLETKKDNELLFDKIPDKFDIHSMRATYAVALYNELEHNEEMKDVCYGLWGNRKDNVKRDTYKSRFSDTVFDRNNLYYVSESLGHNRIYVTRHYIIR